jgi:hypothetical protein
MRRLIDMKYGHKEYYLIYSQDDDSTFKMCDIINEDGSIASTEVVGFAYGEYDKPDDVTDGLIAVFG